MGMRKPTGDRVPLGYLTNISHGGVQTFTNKVCSIVCNSTPKFIEANHTRPGLVPLDGDPTEKEEAERERENNMQQCLAKRGVK